MSENEIQVLVPASIFQAALNYIRHVGANHTMRGAAHPQQWIVDGLELAAANQPEAVRPEVEPPQACICPQCGTRMAWDFAVSPPRTK